MAIILDSIVNGNVMVGAFHSLIPAMEHAMEILRSVVVILVIVFLKFLMCSVISVQLTHTGIVKVNAY